MEYKSSLDGLTSNHFEGFCVGWGKPLTGEKLLAVLKSSYRVVVAMKDGQVVGFVQAISDGLLAAYIPLLEVRPEYQNLGIGQELVKQLLAELKDLYMIDLSCDEDLSSYYQKFGMVPVRGMCKRNFESPFLKS